MAFIAFSFIVIFFTPKVEGNLLEFIFGFIAVITGAIAENVSTGWADDNLTIPVTIGITLWILYALFLPHLPLILQNVPN